MKHALLAIFLLLALLGGAWAQQPAPAPTSPPELQLPAPSPAPPAEQQQALPRRLANITPDSPADLFANVCYTMNSFVFARTDGGDAVRLVAQRTCTPAAKFRVKKATVTMTTPGR